MCGYVEHFFIELTLSLIILSNFTAVKLVPNNLNVLIEIFITRIANPNSKTTGIANPCRRKENI